MWYGGTGFLRAVAISSVIGHVGGGIFGAAITLYGIREIGFEPGVLYMIYAVGGVASVVGAVVTRRATKKFGIGPIMVSCALVSGVVSLSVPLASGPLIIAGALFVLAQLTDSLDTIRSINEVSYIQTAVPDGLLGRVNASLHVVSVGALLAGALLAGLMGEAIGLRLALLVGAGCFLVSGLWRFLSPFRTLNVLPSSLAPNHEVG